MLGSHAAQQVTAWGDASNTPDQTLLCGQVDVQGWRLLFLVPRLVALQLLSTLTQIIRGINAIYWFQVSAYLPK